MSVHFPDQPALFLSPIALTAILLESLLFSPVGLPAIFLSLIFFAGIMVSHYRHSDGLNDILTLICASSTVGFAPFETT